MMLTSFAASSKNIIPTENDTICNAQHLVRAGKIGMWIVTNCVRTLVNASENIQNPIM